MTFPNFENKHKETALFYPGQYIDYAFKIKNFEKLPKKYIIMYYAKPLVYFKKKYKPKKIKLDGITDIYQYKDIGVVKMSGIGAPHATTVFEELIALGGREFINMGSAGGLKDFGVFLCEKAIRDEGTSYHYAHKDEMAVPDKELTERLGKFLKKNNINFEKSTSWTIDAPYMETKAEIQHYKKQGVKTVEMEASALFIVAKLRKVKIASVFVVSDVLGEQKWDPQFDKKHVVEKLNKLVDISINCLQNK